MMVKAAFQWGARPPHIWWGLPGEKWSQEDTMLATAFTHLESLRCSCGCGGWEDWCRDEELADVWALEPVTYHRKKLLDEYRSRASETKGAGELPHIYDLRFSTPEERSTTLPTVNY